MGPTHNLTRTLAAAFALCVLTTAALAADPGFPIPGSGISDQKPGSILIYNIYTSSLTNPVAQNSRISITNTDDERAITVHLFFVDGDSCSAADTYLCLSKSQTVSVMASEVDPGISGYVIGMAVDANGNPAAFDRLIGSVSVRFASGHTASLGAEAVASPAGAIRTFPVPGADGSAVVILFDGVSLDRLPRVLALDNVQSRLDGNDTMLIVNRIGGDLRTSGAAIDKLFGILFDEVENPYSFSIFNLSCQVRRSLNNDFPRTAPRFNSVLGPGRSGWLKFWASVSAVDPVIGQTNRALTGAAINYNASADLSASLFSQGHNLHKLTVGDPTALIVPIFAPSCR
jgi:hypothetical protein